MPFLCCCRNSRSEFRNLRPLLRTNFTSRVGATVAIATFALQTLALSLCCPSSHSEHANATTLNGFPGFIRLRVTLRFSSCVLNNFSYSLSGCSSCSYKKVFSAEKTYNNFALCILHFAFHGVISWNKESFIYVQPLSVI